VAAKKLCFLGEMEAKGDLASGGSHPDIDGGEEAGRTQHYGPRQAITSDDMVRQPGLTNLMHLVKIR
jgi:hypothetical protein